MVDVTQCPICNSGASLGYTNTLTIPIECPRCGAFAVTAQFLGARGSGLTPHQIANASGWIREHQGITLYARDLEMLKNLAPLNIGEKSDRLLMLLAKKYPDPDVEIELEKSGGTVDPEIIARCWAKDSNEVRYLYHTYLASKSLVQSKIWTPNTRNRIMPAGWDYLHQLRQVNPDSQIGFCAIWFDASLTELSQSIASAITEAGFDPKIMNLVEHNNRIDDEIIASIRRSRFIVADFTHGEEKGARGGVYFEAGFGLGLGLPVIHTCRQDMLDLKKIHFDNRQYNFVTWEADKLPDFKTRLINRITATVGTGRSKRA